MTMKDYFEEIFYKAFDPIPMDQVELMNGKYQTVPRLFTPTLESTQYHLPDFPNYLSVDMCESFLNNFPSEPLLLNIIIHFKTRMNFIHSTIDDLKEYRHQMDQLLQLETLFLQIIENQNILSGINWLKDGLNQIIQHHSSSPPNSTDIDINQFGYKELVSEVGHSSIGSQVDLATLRSLYLKSEITRLISVNKNPLGGQKTILITGGAGFVGSHLVDRLMLMGHKVIVLDNFTTGDKCNLSSWIDHPNFQLEEHDVIYPYAPSTKLDYIYHLASPASPVHYQSYPIQTVRTLVLGTINQLGLAEKNKCPILLASTSEVYGDPHIHPQPESYFGNCNPIGSRACYDEGKRIMETLAYAYKDQADVSVRVARIFNTFGPRMNSNDGRVISNFLLGAFNNQSIVIYGKGNQTRSFQYIHDLVDGMLLLMESGYQYPVNLGTPNECNILQLAKIVERSYHYKVDIKLISPTEDDPKQRQPNIRLAKKVLGWEPRFGFKQAFEETRDYFMQFNS